MFCKHCGEPMNDIQAVCLKCGVEAGNGNSFCPNCGGAVSAEAAFCTSCGVALKTCNVTKPSGDVAGITRRDIVTAIILSIVTCGIYSIYWFVCLTNDMNKASGRNGDTNGGIAFLLTLVTCGIYGIYWAYKIGEKRDIVVSENSSSNVLYLVLSLVGFGIVVYCLAQDALNKAIEKQ